MDESVTWRIFYRIDAEVVLVLGVHPKKTNKTPDSVIKECKNQLRIYDKNK